MPFSKKLNKSRIFLFFNHKTKHRNAFLYLKDLKEFENKISKKKF